MPKNRIRLDDIRITSPCPASWENMQGDDRVRFCSICSKNVYNLSAMTGVEAELLLNEKEGKLCARIYLRKDGSVMASDCPVGLREIRKRFAKRIVSIAALVLSLFGAGRLLIEIHYGNSYRVDKMPSMQGQIPGKTTPEQLEALGYISGP